VGELGVLEVEHVLNNDGAVLGGRLDRQSALVGLLDDDVQPAGNRGLGLLDLLALGDLLLDALPAVAILKLILGKGGVAVLIELVLLVVVQVGNGEGNGDASKVQTRLARRSLIIKVRPSGSRNSLLVAKGALQHNLLLSGDIDKLPRAVVEEVLDAGRGGLVLLDALLKLDLAGELGRELLVELILGVGHAADRCGKGSDGLLGTERRPENIAC